MAGVTRISAYQAHFRQLRQCSFSSAPSIQSSESLTRIRFLANTPSSFNLGQLSEELKKDGVTATHLITVDVRLRPTACAP